MYMILDIDNCIADDLWRIPRINWNNRDPLRRYHDYHMLSPWDAAENYHLHNDYEGHVVVLTSRPTLYRPLTEEWLWRNGVHYEHLVMRPDNDHSKSVDLKRMQVGWLFDHYSIAPHHIDVAYDDRQEVVDMYTSLGINAQVALIHQGSIYHEFKS
jgi:hypothetical protein